MAVDIRVAGAVGAGRFGRSVGTTWVVLLSVGGADDPDDGCANKRAEVPFDTVPFSGPTISGSATVGGRGASRFLRSGAVTVA